MGATVADGSLEPEAFGRLMTALRPRLHRYCARMVGSAIDGEDVVQDALAKAAEAYPAAGAIDRPGKLAIPHRPQRGSRRAAAQKDADRAARVETVPALASLPDPRAAKADARVGATASLGHLVEQPPPAQRSSLLLIDLLGHSLGRDGRYPGRQPRRREGRPAPRSARA